MSASCAPVHDEQGELRGAVLVLHDLTLERALDTTTRRADHLAALGSVALGLAHEIRNPLGGIKGAAQLLRANLSDPAQVQATDVIIREVDRLDGLIEQLRGLGTPPHLQLAPQNIHRILNDVLALQRQAPDWGQIVLRTEFDPSLPAVLGDRAQLTQVFLNLVRNAVESLGGQVASSPSRRASRPAITSAVARIATSSSRSRSRTTVPACPRRSRAISSPPSSPPRRAGPDSVSRSAIGSSPSTAASSPTSHVPGGARGSSSPFP